MEDGGAGGGWALLLLCARISSGQILTPAAGLQQLDRGQDSTQAPVMRLVFWMHQCSWAHVCLQSCIGSVADCYLHSIHNDQFVANTDCCGLEYFSRCWLVLFFFQVFVFVCDIRYLICLRQTWFDLSTAGLKCNLVCLSHTNMINPSVMSRAAARQV